MSFYLLLLILAGVFGFIALMLFLFVANGAWLILAVTAVVFAALSVDRREVTA